MKRKVLLLGDPALYEVSSAVTREELEELRPDIEDMFECLKDAGFGHGISAPQIGIKKRLICLDLDGVRRVIVNPTLELVGSEMMELMDDCLCFPGLLVKVRRNRRCIVRYRDENWQVQELACEGYLSELIQHEYDHLNGILATLQKKLVVNTANVLFDLLGKTGSRSAITAAGDYLSGAMYLLLRHLYRRGKGNEELFGVDAVSFDAGAVEADMAVSRMRYQQALQAEPCPPMTVESLTAYPGLGQSVAQVVHNTDERCKKLP